MKHLVLRANEKSTIIIGCDEYSPVSMIAPASRYSTLSKELAKVKEHTVYFDSWRVQGVASKNRFVKVFVKYGKSDPNGFQVISKEDLPNLVLNLCETELSLAKLHEKK